MRIDSREESLRSVRAGREESLSASVASDEESGFPALRGSSDGFAVTWVVPRAFVPRQKFFCFGIFCSVSQKIK